MDEPTNDLWLLSYLKRCCLITKARYFAWPRIYGQRRNIDLGIWGNIAEYIGGYQDYLQQRPK